MRIPRKTLLALLMSSSMVVNASPILSFADVTADNESQVEINDSLTDNSDNSDNSFTDNSDNSITDNSDNSLTDDSNTLQGSVNLDSTEGNVTAGDNSQINNEVSSETNNVTSNASDGSVSISANQSQITINDSFKTYTTLVSNNYYTTNKVHKSTSTSSGVKDKTVAKSKVVATSNSNTTEESPKTGDPASILAYAGTGLSAAGALLAGRKKFRK